MTAIGRRGFLAATLAGGTELLATDWRRTARALLGGAAQSPDARIEVLLEEPIGTIPPELYGHFTEHLGGVIYDGVWVGEQSKVPTIGGVRRALVEALRAIKPSVIRWPGGCFADSYDWRDGVGPREQRPRRTNFWADDPHFKDPHEVNSFEHPDVVAPVTSDVPVRGAVRGYSFPPASVTKLEITLGG